MESALRRSSGVVRQPCNCCFEIFNVIDLWHAEGLQASQEEMCVMEGVGYSKQPELYINYTVANCYNKQPELYINYTVANCYNKQPELYINYTVAHCYNKQPELYINYTVANCYNKQPELYINHTVAHFPFP